MEKLTSTLNKRTSAHSEPCEALSNDEVKPTPTAVAAVSTTTSPHAKAPEDSFGAESDCPIGVSASALPRPSEPAAATPV
jgi:hypothetical protein